MRSFFAIGRLEKELKGFSGGNSGKSVVMGREDLFASAECAGMRLCGGKELEEVLAYSGCAGRIEKRPRDAIPGLWVHPLSWARFTSAGRCLLEHSVFFAHVGQQVADAVRIAPFVVVPAHELEESRFSLGRLFCSVARES